MTFRLTRDPALHSLLGRIRGKKGRVDLQLCILEPNLKLSLIEASIFFIRGIKVQKGQSVIALNILL
jgi:hypothetical protein